jgi:hypothetical protein
VESVQLPSPFLLGSNALATAAAPASPILLPACQESGGDGVNAMVADEREGTINTLGSLVF